MEKYITNLAIKFGLPSTIILSAIIYILRTPIINYSVIYCFGILLFFSIILSILSIFKNMKNVIRNIHTSLLDTVDELASNNLEIIKYVKSINFKLDGKLTEDALKYHIIYFISSLKLEILKNILSNSTIGYKQIISAYTHDIALRSTLKHSDVTIILTDAVEKSLSKTKLMKDSLLIINVLDSEFIDAEEKLKKLSETL